MFDDIQHIKNLSIYLSFPKSILSCFHIVEYIDLTKENAKAFLTKRMSALKFNTEDIHPILNNIKISSGCSKSLRLTVFGDNLDKYIQEIKEILKMRCNLEDDYCQSTSRGCLFLRENVLNEIYQYNGTNSVKFIENETIQYPYLLVMINNKIIFIKVTSKLNSEIIYESKFDFDLILKIAKTTFNVGCLEDFFNIIQEPKENVFKSENHEDNAEIIAFSLLETILRNMVDIMLLHSHIHNFKKIIIGEYYENKIFMEILENYLNNNLKGKLDVYFMRHNGFLTALGSLFDEISKLNIPGNISECHTWWENYALSSGLYQTQFTKENLAIQTLALDDLNSRLVAFPHLKNPENYDPYIYDLRNNKEMREYFVNHTLKLVKQTTKHINNFQGKPTITEKYIAMKDNFEEKVNLILQNPYSYGGVTFGFLHELLSHVKVQLRLIDTYYEIKMKEVRLSLNALPSWLQHFDDLPANQRHEELVKSLLAGNTFDWASPQVHQLFDSTANNFKSALDSLPNRPWCVDNLDLWLERMKGPPHKFAAVFPDNCGFDFVLGIIPFIRELSKRGTKVVLCVNKGCIYNDLTADEARKILEEISLICPIISQAYKNNQLLVMEQARSLPMIDLRYVNEEFANLCKDVDLIVLTGMGRAIISNIYANFYVESIKIGIIKDAIFANKFGGAEFAPLFSYTKTK